jgi:hypothetical protein
VNKRCRVLSPRDKNNHAVIVKHRPLAELRVFGTALPPHAQAEPYSGSARRVRNGEGARTSLAITIPAARGPRPCPHVSPL